MNIFTYKGKRVRYKDKSLIRDILALLASFTTIVVMLLFHGNRLRLQGVAYIGNINMGYLVGSVVTTLFLCLVLCFLYYRYCNSHFIGLVHRQKLAQLFVNNRWYESEQRQCDGFFADSPQRTKQVVTYFPKVFYRLKDGTITINVEVAMGRYQKLLLNLENRLETGLYCELVGKELKESYIEYTFIRDLVRNRIMIDDVVVCDGKMKLMENVYWEFDEIPHMLVSGGTGSGKTYFVLTLVKALADANANLFICDPKNADLADLSVILPNVYHAKDEMIDCLENFCTAMLKRTDDMRSYDNYKTGENYAYLGLEPNFLIMEEYPAFMTMLDKKEQPQVVSYIQQIANLGRQAGFFLILIAQRPDAKYLADGIRDQFHFRVALGKMSDAGYKMAFGDVEKDFYLKQIKGRGYVDNGRSVINEFFSPLIPKGYDFLKEIPGKIPDECGACEAEATDSSEGLDGECRSN